MASINRLMQGSEFRQNLVSGEWVLIAAGRKNRPEAVHKRDKFYQTSAECPFCDLAKTGQETVWRYPDNDDWAVTVIRNKFPAVQTGVCDPGSKFGPFEIHMGKGTHDVFVYRDHEIQLHDFTRDQLVQVIRAYKRRYREIEEAGGCIKYIMVFHNFGREAGASIYHSHSQILSTPILPPNVQRSLHGSYRYYGEHRKRVSDVIVLWEKEQGKRIVWENDFFVAFCPYASKNPGAVRIYPKSGSAHFNMIPDEMDPYFADILRACLKKMKIAFDDPAYNFFIHTAPTETVLGDMHEFYCWHVEIMPKFKIDAGFEMGTGVDINMMDPDEAADKLRQVAV